MSAKQTPPVRRIAVYHGATLALLIEDRPGTLHSTAAPGPAGPPRHPFLHGEARDALSEHELGLLLQEADSFDAYLLLLLDAGYDLLLYPQAPGDLASPPQRIVDAQGRLAGVRWPGRGGIFSLQGKRLGRVALPRITLYARDALGPLLRALDADALRVEDSVLHLPD